MAVIVRLTDPASAHLKRRAEQLGHRVIKNGGGMLTEIMDGYIVRAQGNEDRAVVTVIGLPAAWTSPVSNFYLYLGVSTLVRECRMTRPNIRAALDAIDSPASLPVVATPEHYQPFQAGVAVMAGAPFQSITAGSWSTADPIIQPGVITCAATRSGSLDGAWITDMVIYRATAGRKALATDSGGYQIEFRVGDVVSAGELAYILLDASSMGFDPGTPSAPSIVTAPRAIELSVGEGVAAVSVLAQPAAERAMRVARYSVDLETSSVNVAWRYSVPDLTPVALFSVGAEIRALASSVSNLQQISFDPDGGFSGASTLFSAVDGLVSNPTGYEVDGRPWFFCPRRKTPELAPDLVFWTAREDIDAVLVSPDGAVVPVSTPGYYVQRATNRVDRLGSDDDGTIAPEGGPMAGRVAWYGTIAFPEFGVSNVCVYAPGILAVVVCPDADFALPTQRRYLALVNATTGALIQISAEPICTRDVWYGVSLGCYEQGTVNDDTGALEQHGRLLVSVWRRYIASLDVAPPDPATLGVWVTVDAGETLVPLYQPATYSTLAPIQRATYLGSPLLPAAIGESRRQWI